MTLLRFYSLAFVGCSLAGISGEIISPAHELNSQESSDASPQPRVGGTTPPLMIAVVREGTNARVFWSGKGGNAYILQSSTNLVLDKFADFGSPVYLPGSGSVTTNNLDIGTMTSVPRKFYRARLY